MAGSESAKATQEERGPEERESLWCDSPAGVRGGRPTGQAQSRQGSGWGAGPTKPGLRPVVRKEGMGQVLPGGYEGLSSTTWLSIEGPVDLCATAAMGRRGRTRRS